MPRRWQEYIWGTVDMIFQHQKACGEMDSEVHEEP